MQEAVAGVELEFEEREGNRAEEDERRERQGSDAGAEREDADREQQNRGEGGSFGGVHDRAMHAMGAEISLAIVAALGGGGLMPATQSDTTTSAGVL